MTRTENGRRSFNWVGSFLLPTTTLLAARCQLIFVTGYGNQPKRDQAQYPEPAAPKVSARLFFCLNLHNSLAKFY